MLKSVDELKALIVWMKSQKVASIKIDSIEVQLSQYAFIDDLVSEATKPTLNKLTDSNDGSSASDADKAKEDEEALFWSSNS